MKWNQLGKDVLSSSLTDASSNVISLRNGINKLAPSNHTGVCSNNTGECTFFCLSFTLPISLYLTILSLSISFFLCLSLSLSLSLSHYLSLSIYLSIYLSFLIPIYPSLPFSNNFYLCRPLSFTCTSASQSPHTLLVFLWLSAPTCHLLDITLASSHLPSLQIGRASCRERV